MFVVHALILTFMTTPLVILFYPAKYRIHHHGDKPARGDEAAATAPRSASDDDTKTRFALLLDKIEALPAAMTLSQLLHSPNALSSASGLSSIDEKAVEAGFKPALAGPPSPAITIEALRLIELTNRTSAVLRSQEADSLIYNDPVVSVYRTFGQLNHFNVSANLEVVNFDAFPEAIAKHVTDTNSQMVIIPWPRGATSVLEEETQSQRVGTRNPFDGIFHKTTSEDQTSSVVYSEFIRNVFAKSPSDIALFVDRGVFSASSPVNKQHLFLPFFGGPDDRLALNFLVQLCEQSWVAATVVRLNKVGATSPTTESGPGAAALLSPAFHNVSVLKVYHLTKFLIPNRPSPLPTPSMVNLIPKLALHPIRLITSSGTATLDQIHPTPSNSPLPSPALPSSPSRVQHHCAASRNW